MMERDAAEHARRFLCVLKGDYYYCPVPGNPDKTYRVPRENYEAYILP